MRTKKYKIDKMKSLVEILMIIALFIFFSYFIQKNISLIRPLIGNSLVSMFLYIFIVVIAIVVAPVSAMPILPIASNQWGWFLGGILSIIGWMIGALIAFVVARKYGAPLVKKLVSLEKIKHAETLVPKKNIFWSIVFLRMVIPVDILSYALGLFSKISLKKYLLATLLGVSPFAFVFAYLGIMPVYYQIVALIIALLIFIAGWFIAVKRKIKTKKEVVVKVFYWGGKKFGIKIKSSCKECDISIPIIENLLKEKFKDRPVKLEVKPWLDNFLEVLFRYTAWHAPVIVVNNQLISQGKVVDIKELKRIIEKKLRK